MANGGQRTPHAMVSQLYCCHKKAVPVEKALKIIGFEVKDKMLDEELFRIFREKELWRLTVK